MQCTKSVIFTTLLTTLIVGGVSYVLFHKDTGVPNITPTNIRPFVGDERLGSEPAVPVDTPPVATSTLSYYIPEMGVRFEYPAYATVTAGTSEGTTGSILSGTIHLSGDQNTSPEKGRIFFRGMTEDFS